MDEEDAVKVITNNLNQLSVRLEETGLWEADSMISGVKLLRELQGGSLNKVYRVELRMTEDSNHQKNCSVIYKHAPPYFKVNPSHPLPAVRVALEFTAFNAFHRLSPGCVPVPLHYDTSIFVEDLKTWVVLNQELIEGRVDAAAVENFMGCLATIHNKTSSSSEEWSALSGKFLNNIMSDITAEYVFTYPFTHHKNQPKRKPSETPYHPLFSQAVDSLRSDDQCLRRIKQLKELFLGCNDCFCHGDLHTGSVMIKNGQFKMIDAEFACLSPSWYDLGMFLANMVLALIRHHTLNDNDTVELIKTAITSGVRKYMSIYEVISGSVTEYITNACGFIGTEIIRRVIGLAGYNNPHLSTLPEGELKALAIGRAFLKA